MLSVGAISFELVGFALAKKGGTGEVDGYSHDMSWTGQLPWLAVEGPRWHWLGRLFLLLTRLKTLVGGPFLALYTVFSQEKHSLIREP